MIREKRMRARRRVQGDEMRGEERRGDGMAWQVREQGLVSHSEESEMESE